MHHEDVLYAAIVRLGPDLRVVLDADQLRHDAHRAAARAVGGPLHGALQDVADAQLVADLARRLLRAGVLVGADARDDPEAVEGRQATADLLGDAGGEVGHLRLAQVAEGQHDDASGGGSAGGRRLGSG